MSADVAVVAGGGGFIGGHLVRELLEQGFNVRVADIRAVEQWQQVHNDAENVTLDLRNSAHAEIALSGAAVVYNLAADMGGMGYIEHNKARCMLSVLINTNLLQAARAEDVTRYFFASSACVYAADKQDDPLNPGLREADAYPAMPEDGYGWEKLFSERMCRHFREDFGVPTRVARYHNVYGPLGTWTGGREKAPAAICRKVAEAQLSGRHEIEIWGDGHQTRSFMYIDDCIFGTRALTWSDVIDPVNVGSSEMVTIDELVSVVEDIAGIECHRNYDTTAPTGVTGRNSDNTMIRSLLGWEPSIPLRAGLEKTYEWILEQVEMQARVF